MAYYLSMDGVDDKFQTPSITFNKVVIEALYEQVNNRYYFDSRSGFSNGWLLRNNSGTDEWGSHISVLSIDGVSKSKLTQAIPFNTRHTMEIQMSTTLADDVMFLAHNGGTSGFMKANIYSIKFYNGTTLVAHYDMSTQTVQDQSGNGNHATLVGGTWVDDGTGGGEPVGTDVSYSYAMRQSIFADRTAQAPLKQEIYADRITQAPTAQKLYADRQTQYPIKQAFYADRQAAFPTLQAIYEDQANSFPMTQALFADRAFSYAMEQRIYADREWDYPMLQQIFSDYILYSADFPMMQIIHADRTESFPTKQQIYKDVQFDFPLLIRILLEIETWKTPSKPVTTWLERLETTTEWQTITQSKTTWR